MSDEIVSVLSRRTVNPVMAARGMRSAAELADGKPCGTRVRYYAGCRCQLCRKANSLYDAERQEARKRGEANGLVSAERARAHLKKLSAQGVGRKTAADAAKVAASVVGLVIDGQRTKIRAQTERRILAVTATTAADGSRRSARATWRMLDELIACGYPKARLATEILGREVRSLQIGKRNVTLRNEALVRGVYERLRLADAARAARAHALVRDLREEGFRPDRIQLEVDKLAAARGWPAPSISPRPRVGRWPMPDGMTHRATMLIEQVHAALTREDA